MNLNDYIALPGSMTSAELARAIGCDPAQVRQWLALTADGTRDRRPGAVYCVAISRATNGAVARWDLRDDWHLIWPEMIGTEGAPVIPAAAAA